ncbi:class I SAM-dependent methyltransferase [Sphingomonas panacisoli]|uniref:Class I SAM-dependent methyltransferase n=1 Tax=Sphingomonas panacisoli TaxID=1813879 RepID=A0A5B8LID3_9SPHN|nr:class I SAM-dependent methyltransferase [Sphingomonas panacisoli]QDZ06910.1 class I SAM-dependent methyltransferase [Sphingomonas panacisoli]
MAARFIAQQLAKPEGLGGKFIRLFMNRVNSKLNDFAVEQLKVETSDRVLEIGFGGGVTLKPLLSRARFVCGVDPSSDVVDVARRRFATFVETGRADFLEGTAEALPLPDRAFDKVLTANTVYFWASLERGLQEIRRVLAPSGRVVIGFTPQVRMDRMNLPDDIFTSRTADAIEEALRNTGFIDAEIRAPWGEDQPMVATAIVTA